MAEAAEHAKSSVPARGTMQLLLARLGFLAIGFVVTVILARHLGPAAYSAYGVCLSLLVWLEMASNSGLQNAAAKRLQSLGEDPGRLEVTAKLLHFSVSLALFAVVLLLAPALARWLRLDAGANLLRIALLDLPFAGFYFAQQGLLSGHRRFGLLSVGLIAYAFTKLLGVLFLLAIGVTVEGALIVNVVATLGGIACFLGRTGAGPRTARPSPRLARALVRLAIPMGTYLILSQAVLNFDLWLLKAWGGGEAEAGRYAAAAGLARSLSVVPSALSGVVFASLARALAHGDDELVRHHVRSGGRFALIALMPAAAFAAQHDREIMRFVYGAAYEAGGPSLGLLVSVFACAGLLDTYGHALMAAGHERLVALLFALGVPIAVALDAVWIPTHGGRGAAGASLVAIGLATAGVVFFTSRRFGTLLPPRTMIRVLIATACGLLLGWLIRANGLWLVLELAGLCLVYLAVLVLLGEISRNDLRKVLPW